MRDTAGFHIVTRSAPQWDVIALFAVLLVAALGISIVECGGHAAALQIAAGTAAAPQIERR